MNEWLLIMLTIFLSGFFSGSEIAFVTANKLKLEVASRRQSFLAKAVAFFIKNPETFLTTTLVGNNIVNVVYATLMAIFLIQPVTSFFELWFGVTPGAFEILLFQTIIASLVIMLFGEIIPKAIFRAQADFLILAISLPMRLCYWLLRPLIGIANAASNVLIRILQPNAEKTELVFKRQDVENIFRELKDGGGSEDLDEDDSEILHNVLELSNKRVKESMIPRTEITAVEKGTGIEELRSIFIESGYSKLPVFQDNIDNIIGIVFAHELFDHPKTMQEITRPATLVPSSKKSNTLLTEFRQSKTSVAVVIDEYGGTAGMVTIEDLLEEVVGDIQDEYDTEDSLMRQLSETTFVLSGNVEIDELNEKFSEINLPVEPSEYDTVAGFIINFLGRIPKVNEELVIDGHKFIISKASPSKLETVKLILIQ